MLPYHSIIQLERTQKTALYQQLAHQIIQLINQGILVSGTQLPSSRQLAEVLEIHRKTVVSGYEELILQGWLETIPQKGTFVKHNLPKLQSKSISLIYDSSSKVKAGFQFKQFHLRETTQHTSTDVISINDGIPDVRLAPSKQIGQYFKEASNTKFLKESLGYESPLGSKKLRKVLASFIQETRGVFVNEGNLLITRGSQMGIYLSAKALLNSGDHIVVGETNYKSADLTFESFGGHLVRVEVDNFGLKTDQIESYCLNHKIKAVYVTSHHHHPTTVTLSAERRLHLLNLAHKYEFAIIEDDYDYDFHYKRSPILPLAAHDINANVIYIGSLCKTVAPGYRIGYLIASVDFVNACGNYRRFIDRQGDLMLEYAFARFIESGDLIRHTNKVMKIYEERRTYFCQLLERHLSSYLTFVYPQGGMAVWLTLKNGLTWEMVTTHALDYGIEFGEWQRYDYAQNNHQSIRMGFANYTKEEISNLISQLKVLFSSL